MNLPGQTRKAAYKLMLLSAFFLLAGFASAQPFQLTFHHLSPNEGLSQGTNSFVYQDSKGFIWLSSLDGLNRFDGKSVKVYKAIANEGLIGNTITSSFFEDKETNLWFTTHEAIHCYLRQLDEFVHFQVSDDHGNLMTSDYMACYLEKGRYLWLRVGLGSEGRLHCFDILTGKSRIVCPIDGLKNYPILEQDSSLSAIISTNFFGKNGFELIELNPNEPSDAIVPKRYADGALSQKSLVAFPQADSVIWLGMENGLIRYPLSTGQIRLFSRFEDRPVESVRAISQLDDQHLILASSAEEVLIFDTDSEQFIQQLTVATKGQRSENAIAFYVDPQETLWLSGARNGVLYGNMNKQKFFKSKQLENIPVTTIFEATDGKVWVNWKDRSMLRFESTQMPPEVIPLPQPDGPFPIERFAHLFNDRQGSLWGGVYNMLYRWDESTSQFSVKETLPNFLLYPYVLADGTLVISTYGGLYTRTGPSAFQPFLPVGDYQKSQATAIFEDQKQRLYLALDATRLGIFEKQGSQYAPPIFIEKIGLAKAFYETDSCIWVATSKGLLKIDRDNFDHQLLTASANGIPTEHYYAILPDQQGNLWLSCNRGIIRYSPAEQQSRRFTLADGLQDLEFNTNSFLARSNGELWLGGAKGLNVFNPESIRDVPFLPKVHITSLLINDMPVSDFMQVEAVSSLGKLPFRENTLSFGFVALEYSDPSNNTFQYKLENYDEDWVFSGRNDFVRYPNLPPGQYTFKVKAANSDGIWNEESTTMDVFIMTPWWRTWWFYTLCVLFVASIVYGIFMYRLQQALKIERMRVKISSDLHDDVGTILSGLAMQSEVLELTASEKSRPKLKRISELSRSAMSRMRDTVWAIDARKDKLENLVDRMREHAEETLTPNDILLDLQVDQLAESKKIHSQVRQNLYLIYKEAITNVAKHSNGNKVVVRIVKMGGGLEMTIHDNGKVEQKSYKTTGLGTSNMKMRAENIGGSLNIDTTDGFLIQVKLPKL